MSHTPNIAIIGAGFKGIITTYQLVQQSSIPLTIQVYDHSAYAKQDIAYSTDCPFHLLNVPCERMGALHYHPEDFYRWLSQHPDNKYERQGNVTHTGTKKGVKTPTRDVEHSAPSRTPRRNRNSG